MKVSTMNETLKCPSLNCTGWLYLQRIVSSDTDHVYYHGDQRSDRCIIRRVTIDTTEKSDCLNSQYKRGSTNMPKVNEWACEIEITINQFGLEAETKEEFIQKTKELFLEDHNLDLEDHEIKNIQVI